MIFKFIFPLSLLFVAIADENYQVAKNDGGQAPPLPKPEKLLTSMPRPSPGKPLVVKISAVITKVSIDMDKKELQTTFSFRQEWNDPRLAFVKKGKAEFRQIETRGSIWTPDLAFVNGVVNETIVKGDNDTYIKNFPDGRILFAERKTVTTFCSVNCRNYPFDSLTCQLQIESYGHGIDDIIVQWNESDDQPAVTERYLSNDFVTSITSEPGITVFRGAKFSSPTMVFSASRTPSAIIFRIILPLIVITVCTWMSYLLAWGEKIMRVSLYITPIVTYILQINFCIAFFVSPEFIAGLLTWTVSSVVIIIISAVEFLIVFRNQSVNNGSGNGSAQSNLNNRVVLAIFVSFLDILSIVSVFLSRLM